jgi:hypothetical protein
MNLLILFAGIALLCANLTSAKDLDSSKAIYELRLGSVNRSHRTRMSNLGKNYTKALHSLLSKVQKAGDLDKTTGVKKEIARFKLSQTMPEKPSTLGGIQNLQTLFTQSASKYAADKSNQVISLTLSHEKSLEILQRQLVSSDKLNEARMVQKEREAVMTSEEYRQAVRDRPPISLSKEVEATLYICGDNSFQVWLNGKEIGKEGNWGMLYNFALKIREGDLLAILAKDHARGNRTAGLYACIVLKDSGKSWSTDKSWSCSIKRQDSRLNKHDDNRWLKSHAPLISDGKASEGNVHPSHLSRVSDYRKKYHKNLRGAFIWSAKPSKVVYFKEKIKLSNFK